MAVEKAQKEHCKQAKGFNKLFDYAKKSVELGWYFNWANFISLWNGHPTVATKYFARQHVFAVYSYLLVAIRTESSVGLTIAFWKVQ